MNKTITTFGILTLVASVMGSDLVAAAKADSDEVPLKLRACVAPGEAKDSYLLTNVEVEGTTLAPANAFYRFDTTSGLKSQVGHRVEITGTADLDDPDKGKLRVKIDDGKIETKVRSEGKTVTADQNLWFGTPGSAKLKADIVTYKFKTDKVQRIEGSCAR